MPEGAPQWAVSRLSRREQIHFHWAKLGLHHLGGESPLPGPQPLPRQDICSLVLVPWDEHRSERRQFPLVPQEDLVSQLA